MNKDKTKKNLILNLLRKVEIQIIFFEEIFKSSQKYFILFTFRYTINLNEQKFHDWTEILINVISWMGWIKVHKLKFLTVWYFFNNILLNLWILYFFYFFNILINLSFDKTNVISIWCKFVYLFCNFDNFD